MSRANTHWLDRFSIHKQLWLLIGSFVVGSLILGGLITATLRTVQVGGPIYKQVVDGKDLVADILPPPAYLIESWQVTLELATSTPGAEQDALLAKSTALRKDFETRESYWKEILPEGSLRRIFLDGAYPAGKAFLELRDKEFIPAVKRQDMVIAQSVLPRLKSLYLAHRAKIDQVVTQANQRVSSDEQYADEVISTRSLILLVAGAVLLAVLLWLGQTIARVVVMNLGGDVKVAAQIVAKVADGDLESAIPVAATDQQSLMFNLQRMQATLRDAQTQALENARIRRALDSVSSNVRITDPNGTVLYANHQLLRTVDALQEGIRRRIPEFQPTQFVGMDITRFYDDPEAIRRILQQLREDRSSSMDIGGRTFEVKTTPVFDDHEVLIGTIGEWHDQTDLLKVQSEVQAVIEAAKHGDYSQRVELAGKNGFFLCLSASMNALLDSTEKALAELATVLSSLAQGDLTVRMESEFDGMLAQLKNDCNRTIDQLSEIVEAIASSTQAINTAAQEISSGNADLSRRTEQQAASIEETAASMEELTDTVKQNADNAKQANLLATGASEVATKGGKVVGDVVSTMEDINQSARKIVDIISVIDGIAFQTNILALNAAVEAARAGEQGKGFAVVASEVRSLAQRSAGAAKEIKLLINDSVSRTESGSRLVNEAGQTIGEVVTAVRRVTDIVAEISLASVEQSAGIQQVSQTVTQMDEATQQNATLVEEATTAAASLRDQAENLQGLVKRFRLAGSAVTTTHAVRFTGERTPPMRTRSATVRPTVQGDEWSAF